MQNLLFASILVAHYPDAVHHGVILILFLGKSRFNSCRRVGGRYEPKIKISGMGIRIPDMACATLRQHLLASFSGSPAKQKK